MALRPPTSLRRLAGGIALGALASSVLAGCTQGSEVPFGQSQEIEQHGAQLAVTVLDAEHQDPETADLNPVGGNDAYHLPVFVTARVELVSGEMAPETYSALEGRAWHGKGSDGKRAEGLQLIGVHEQCPGLKTAQLETLVETGSVDICVVLLAQTEAELTRVGFGSVYWSATD